MKISLWISAVILVIAAVIGWLLDARIADARAIGRRLGATVDGSGMSSGLARRVDNNRSSRTDREEEAKQLAVAYIGLPKARQRIVIPSVEYDTDVDNKVSQLDPTRLKIFLADVLAAMELDATIVPERVNNLLGNLASNDPRGALDLFTKHASVCRKDMENGVVSTALGAWAKADPITAAVWMKEHAGEFPEALAAQSMGNVFHATAEKDPRLAFTLITTLGLDYTHTFDALHSIVTSAATDEQRNVTLAALREFRDANQGDQERRRAAEHIVGYFSWGFKEDGFRAATRWIAGAKLSLNELDQFCNNLSSNYRGDEATQWIEWMGKTFPPGRGDPCIAGMIRSWTCQDYEAVGKWLGSAPEGPVKNAAISSYAFTIFEHDPETAMQWIMTLPPGDYRDNTLRNIYVNWPKDDKEGAASFAKEHGIK